MSSYYDDASLMLLASGGAGKDGKVYSVKPTDGSGDFTFTRGSNLSATRVNSSQLIEKGRENLLRYSNDFTLAWLLTGSGSSLGSDVAGPIAGVTGKALTLVTGALLFQSTPAIPLGVASVYMRVSTGSVNVALGDPQGSPYETKTLTTTWQRFSILDTASIAGLAIYNSQSGTTINIEIAAAQLEQSLVATPYIETGATTAQAGILENTPRFDYSGGATCPSLLLEPSRTNLTPQSEYFDSGYTFTNVTTAANAAISPEGVSNAYEMTDDATNGNHRFIRQITGNTVGQSYTYSIFLKKGTMTSAFVNLFSGNTIANASVDLENGTILSGSGTNQTIEDYGNDWYRCSVTGVAGNSSVYIYLYMNQLGGYVGAGDNMYFYGAQLEQGSYPTSYIPTYGVSQTRAVDECLDGGDNSVIESTQGTIYGEQKSLETDFNYNYFVAVSDGTNNNRLEIRQAGTALQFLWRVAGVYQNAIILSSAPFSSTIKYALRYSSTDIKFYVNGSLVGTFNSPTLYPAETLNNLQFADGSGGTNFRGVVKQSLYFPTALSDLDLAILTGATTYNTFAEMALALNYTVYE